MSEIPIISRTDILLHQIATAPESPVPRRFLEERLKDPAGPAFSTRALYESLAFLETNGRIDRATEGFSITGLGTERLSQVHEQLAV